MRVGYVGNFGPEHSTENHLTAALERCGVGVVQMQENAGETWAMLGRPEALELDLLLWTRTWHLPELPQAEALSALDRAGVPTVGYHLDRWWGLDREPQIIDEPYFGCDLMVTAELGPDDGRAWAGAGVEHAWYPPGVLRSQALVGSMVAKWRTDVGFVGSWAGYHDEWPWRRELVRWLPRTFGKRARLFPRHPAQAIRGAALADLYASIKVVVGDSCLAPYSDGSTPVRYWSDRVPETLGRGGFLLHPWVDGMEDDGGFVDGEHLIYYEPGNLTALRKSIEWWLDPAHDAERERICLAGRQLVLERHTYERRMLELFTDLADRGLLPAERLAGLTLPSPA